MPFCGCAYRRVLLLFIFFMVTLHSIICYHTLIQCRIGYYSPIIISLLFREFWSCSRGWKELSIQRRIRYRDRPQQIQRHIIDHIHPSPLLKFYIIYFFKIIQPFSDSTTLRGNLNSEPLLPQTHSFCWIIQSWPIHPCNKLSIFLILFDFRSFWQPEIGFQILAGYSIFKLDYPLPLGNYSTQQKSSTSEKCTYWQFFRAIFLNFSAMLGLILNLNSQKRVFGEIFLIYKPRWEASLSVWTSPQRLHFSLALQTLCSIKQSISALTALTRRSLQTI